MNDLEQLIRIGMAKVKIDTISETAKRIGMSRQLLSYRFKHPTTFNAGEIKALSKLFNWSDEDLGKFIRSF